MCEWLVAHCGFVWVGGVLDGGFGGYVPVAADALRGGWVLGWWFGCGIGCFLRLLSFGSVGRLAMCEWRLTHCGVGGCLAGGSGAGVAVFCGCWCLGISAARLCVSGGWHIAGEAGRVVGWSVMCGRFCSACDSRCGCEPVLHNNAALVGNDGRGIVSAAMWPQLLDGW